MDRSKFKVIKGGPNYSISDAPKKFISAFVTNTRLMGVLVLYVHWLINDDEDSQSLHQFFYVETTESGIESYRSIYGNNQKSLIEIEQAMTGGLGGEKVGLTEKDTFLLIQLYAQMNERLGTPMPGGEDEYGFIIEKEIEHTPMDEKAVFQKTCVKITTPEQLINYFLMRYVSADYAAADYLSFSPFDRDIIPALNTHTLCINKIEKRQDENGNMSYMCESLIEDNLRYRIVVSEIRIVQNLVAHFEKISEFAVSSVEAAMKLARPEFITVYEIMDRTDHVNAILNDMYPAAIQNNTESGNVYILFKNNNDHLKEAFYRLNDDIKGIVYVTDEDQLVLVSYSLNQINRFENEIQYSGFGNLVIAIAKYEFKESIFYDFMRSDTGDFLHYMEYISDYDPDEE